jgi:hypothetical protein
VDGRESDGGGDGGLVEVGGGATVDTSGWLLQPTIDGGSGGGSVVVDVVSF